MNIIKWNPGYYPNIEEANPAQRICYKIIKQLISNGIYVDLKGQDAYLYALNIELSKLVSTSSSSKSLRNIFGFYQSVIKLYSDKLPKVVSYFYFGIFAVILKMKLDEERVSKTLSEYIEFCLKNNFSGATDMIIALFIELNGCNKKTYIEPRLFRIFIRTDPKQYLTDFGKKNYNGVLNCLYDLLNVDYSLTGENYLFKMYDFCNGSAIYAPGFGITFSSKGSSELEGSEHLMDNIIIPSISENKRITFSRNILREAENIFRRKTGIQRVGEGWISETLLFRRIEAAFPDIEVEQHASPSFLGRQHYDVYMPEQKVALEYQGEQHFKPVDFFGGESAYNEAVARDLRKKELSRNNNITQIDVLPGYDVKDIIYKLAKILGINNEREISRRIKQAKDININSAEEVDLTVSSESVGKKIKKEKSEEIDLDYEMNKLVSLREKSPYAGCDMFMNVSDECARKMLDEYNEICKISKYDPEESNMRAKKLFESGYRAPAIYERMAINYHKMKKFDEELDLLLQAKVDFGYNFDDRIKKLIKKT